MFESHLFLVSLQYFVNEAFGILTEVLECFLMEWSPCEFHLI